MKKTLFFATVLFISVFACNKSEDFTTDDAVDEALYSIQERGSLGRLGCFELVFPVTLTFPDGTTADVDSYEEMAQSLRLYFQANGPSRPATLLAYPLTVVTPEGDLVSVESAEQMQRLRNECQRRRFANHDARGHSRRMLSCFEITFPVTIQFPDGSTAQAGDRLEFQQLIRVWKQNNPDTTERPHLTFPLTVKLTEEGSLVTIDDRQELARLKESCE